MNDRRAHVPETHRADHHHTNRRITETATVLRLLEQRVEAMAEQLERTMAEHDEQCLKVAECERQISVLETRAKTALWALGAALTLLTQFDKLIQIAASLH